MSDLPSDRFDLQRLVRDQLDLTLTADQGAAFERYRDLLLTWNAHTNLTAITDPFGVTVRHFLDSLLLLRVVNPPDGARLIDVGTGAGFPGLPLAIVKPAIKVTLLEATGKKTAFLAEVVRALGLPNVTILTSRAEDAGQMVDQREHYDLVTARAVAQLSILTEYLLPLCRVGGQCIALKGESAAAEIDAASPAIRLLGGKVARLEKVTLPHVADPHYLIVIDKIAPTPALYPRRTGVPSKKPLT